MCTFCHTSITAFFASVLFSFLSSKNTSFSLALFTNFVVFIVFEPFTQSEILFESSFGRFLFKTYSVSKGITSVVVVFFSTASGSSS